jgi:anaerobic magnesium-protoporphyrin IX monomethyl ester cyclase
MENVIDKQREIDLKIFKQPTLRTGKHDETKCFSGRIYEGKKKIAFCAAEDINPGAGYVMAQLRAQGHDVRLFFDPKQGDRGYQRNDLIANLFGVQDWLIREMNEWHPDIVCFTVLSATYQWGVKFAERVKKEVANDQGGHVHIIFGGTMPTLVPEVVGENWFIDEVVQGDGVRHFGGKFAPDTLWPIRDDFFHELPPEHRHTQLFMTSYGCPYNCTFCGNQQLREVGQYVKMKRSVDCCIAELKMMKERYGLKNVLFVDDILTLDKKWLMEFLPKYKSEIGCPFACFGHVNCIDEEMVKEMARCGCQTMWFGIQSGCPDHRKNILDRPETNEQIITVGGWVKKYGIKLMVDHICGLPYESDITHELSHALYSTIKPDVINVYECLYFPKAKINEYALKCGYITEADVPRINRGQHIVYQQGNKSGHFYNKFVKSLVSIPLGGGAIWEFVPLFVIKSLVFIKAGRFYIGNAMIQNELFFTVRAILKRMGLIKHADYYEGKENPLEKFMGWGAGRRPYTYAKVNR